MRKNTTELIQRILEGDDAAFACLVKKYQKRVHTLAWRKVGDFHIAEDITQETFLQVYRKLPTLKDPSRFPGWLYVIANRCCIAWLRKKRVQTQTLEGVDIAMTESVSYSRYIAAEQAESAAETKRELVKNLLAKLKESDRTVITLYYFGEMTYAEIGEFLGVSVNTVATRVHRARERLKEYEPMIRQAFSSFQLSPDLTENIMREIPHVKPLPPAGGKPPIVPWAIATSTAVLVVIMLGISNQYLGRFQQSYNLDATSEMTVELIEAPVVLDLPSKPDVRNQFGNTNTPGESRNTGKKLEDTLEEEKSETFKTLSQQDILKKEKSEALSTLRELPNNAERPYSWGYVGAYRASSDNAHNDTAFWWGDNIDSFLSKVSDAEITEFANLFTNPTIVAILRQLVEDNRSIPDLARVSGISEEEVAIAVELLMDAKLVIRTENNLINPHNDAISFFLNFVGMAIVYKSPKIYPSQD